MQQELLRRRSSNSLTPNPRLLPTPIPHTPSGLPRKPNGASPVSTECVRTHSMAHSSQRRESPIQQHLRRLRREGSLSNTDGTPSKISTTMSLNTSSSARQHPATQSTGDMSLPAPASSLLRRRPSLSPAADTFTPPITTSYGTSLKRQKALLVGIGYRNHRFLRPLPGCRTDVCNMYELITGPLFAFPKDSVRVLCDELTHIDDIAVSQPTRINILRDLRWLTTDIFPGESVLFFFAGHGDFVEDLSGDEIESGFDQVSLNKNRCKILVKYTDGNTPLTSFIN